jgi:hypothetical protein
MRLHVDDGPVAGAVDSERERVVGGVDLPDGDPVDGPARAVDDDRAVELDDRRRRVCSRAPPVGLERVAAVGDRRCDLAA